jgi:hypothetical protein
MRSSESMMVCTRCSSSSASFLQGCAACTLAVTKLLRLLGNAFLFLAQVPAELRQPLRLFSLGIIARNWLLSRRHAMSPNGRCQASRQCVSRFVCFSSNRRTRGLSAREPQHLPRAITSLLCPYPVQGLVSQASPQSGNRAYVNPHGTATASAVVAKSPVMASSPSAALTLKHATLSHSPDTSRTRLFDLDPAYDSPRSMSPARASTLPGGGECTPLRLHVDADPAFVASAKRRNAAIEAEAVVAAARVDAKPRSPAVASPRFTAPIRRAISGASGDSSEFQVLSPLLTPSRRPQAGT